MSGVVRDLYRYHHWPDRRDYWNRTIRTDAFQRTPRGTEDDLHGIFGKTGEYVGYDNKINYKNREIIRYHHWPPRRNWQNRFEAKKVSIVNYYGKRWRKLGWYLSGYNTESLTVDNNWELWLESVTYPAHGIEPLWQLYKTNLSYTTLHTCLVVIQSLPQFSHSSLISV